MSGPPSTDAIWNELSSDLRRFIRRRVPGEHAAEDLLQETFLRIHRRIGTLGDAERLVGWVYQIARNVIHDHHRRSKNRAEALAADPVGGPDEGPGRGRECQWLERMIQEIPPPYREAVQWFEIDGLSQQDIAARTGLSLSGTKSRIQRGRAMLRETLDQCCRFEFDRRGNLMHCDPRPDQTTCRDCDE